MKKSFLTVIVVVFAISVVVVGVYGLQFDSFEDRIYSNDIKCEEYYYSADGGESIGDLHRFETSGDGKMTFANLEYVEGMRITLAPQLYPLDASILTNKDMEYPYRFTSGNEKVATVDENGIVTFHKQGMVTILITPADGSNISVSVLIRAR